MTGSPEASTEHDEARPLLRPVPAHSAAQPTVADGEVPIGTSDGPGVSEQGPTRGTGPWARARIAAVRAVAVLSEGDRWRGLGHRLFGRAETSGGRAVGGLFRPPDVWSTDRPSLAKQFRYARYGVQHPAGGPLRLLSITFALAGVVIQAGLYYAAWVAERPARLLSGYLLLAVLLQIPPVHDVIVAVVTVLIAPLTWLA
jgi:hypothetical protein